ncbi:unnamed protein product, partial [Heterobilharzia americana]
MTVYKLSFLPHTVFPMSPSAGMPNSSFPSLDSTRRPGLAREVPSRPSQCMPNPSPLSSSAYLLSERFLVGSSQTRVLCCLFFLAIHLSFSNQP